MKNRVYLSMLVLLVPSYCYSNILEHNSSEIICSLYQNINNDDLLLDKIYRLQEVKNKEEYLHKLRGKNAHISLIIDTRPNRHNPDYIVQVGYINTIRLEIFYTFTIESKYVSSVDFIKKLKIMRDNGFTSLLIWRKTHPNSVENP